MVNEWFSKLSILQKNMVLDGYILSTKIIPNKEDFLDWLEEPELTEFWNSYSDEDKLEFYNHSITLVE